MSEDEWEMRGAHEDALEARAHHEPLGQKIALFSAILATLGASMGTARETAIAAFCTSSWVRRAIWS